MGARVAGEERRKEGGAEPATETVQVEAFMYTKTRPSRENQTKPGHSQGVCHGSGSIVSSLP
jgi:hypothetical protein